MAKTFVISDDSVNRYGFRIRTAGIKLENFMKNPVGLYMHQRGGDRMPICRWENLRYEGNRLLGEPVFDMNDPFAKQIADKVEQGIINAVSPGLEMLDYSYDELDMLPNQYGPTVTLSDLQEISFVDIPGNANAISLCNKKATITLGLDEDQAEALNKFFPENPNLQMKKINLALGLAEGTSEDLVLQAISQLKTQKTDAETKLSDEVQKAVQLAADKETLEQKIADIQAAATKKAAEDMIQLASDQGKISAPEKESLLKLALMSEEGYTHVKAVIDTRKPYKPVTAQLAAAKETAAVKGLGEMSFSELRKSHPKHLAELKASDPTEWQRLYDEEFKK